MVDNYADSEESNWPAPAEVVEIGSDDTASSTDNQLDATGLSRTNMDPDLELIEESTVKVVHSHSNFDLHPDDLGFYHYTPPPKTAKEFYEAYEKGIII